MDATTGFFYLFALVTVFAASRVVTARNPIHSVLFLVLTFAPLAFAVPEDPVARDILVAASAALTNLLAAVHDPGLAGPIVVGGSVLIHGLLAAPAGVRFVLPDYMGGVVPVADGVVGAAVLVLRNAGIEVDQTLFDNLREGIAARSM